jgi:predicted nucleic acid-binding protein
VIVADTSGLLAFFNDREPSHEAVRAALTARHDVLVVSPYVVAELDHLVSTRQGMAAELAVLRELAGGAYDLATMGGDLLARAADVVARYRDQSIGVTDASLVVLASHYRTRTILTLDRRHFDVVRPLDGGRFTLLP